jgi:hypothetical protein
MMRLGRDKTLDRFDAAIAALGEKHTSAQAQIKRRPA